MAPPLDIFAIGPVYLDLVFAGLPGLPRPGTEIFATQRRFTLGGVANVAVPAARLGAVTGLQADLGDDVLGDLARSALTSERVVMDWTRTRQGFPQPITVSMAFAGDRAMVTHHHHLTATPVLADSLPPARIYFEYIGDGGTPPVTARQRPATGMVVYDAGWDPSETWSRRALDHVEAADVFAPNAVEAMALTRTTSPEDAARALAARCPLAVVKCGADGVVAADGTSGELWTVPALPVTAVDPTGAGDVFVAGLLVGLLHDLPTVESLELATVVAGISVTRLGGAMSAPDWDELRRVVAGLPSALASRFAFIPHLADLAGTATPTTTPKEAHHV